MLHQVSGRQSPPVIDACASRVCVPTAAEFTVIAQKGADLPTQFHSRSKTDLCHISRRSAAVNCKTTIACAFEARVNRLCLRAILMSPGQLPVQAQGAAKPIDVFAPLSTE